MRKAKITTWIFFSCSNTFTCWFLAAFQVGCFFNCSLGGICLYFQQSSTGRRFVSCRVAMNPAPKRKTWKPGPRAEKWHSLVKANYWRFVKLFYCLCLLMFVWEGLLEEMFHLNSFQFISRFSSQCLSVERGFVNLGTVTPLATTTGGSQFGFDPGNPPAKMLGWCMGFFETLTTVVECSTSTL